MDYKIITASTASDLTARVKTAIEEGYKPVGSHTALTKHEQCRYRGNELGDVVHTFEYAQTVVKE